jgi:cytoskeletal protein RodZ
LEIGKKLREAREEKGITIDDLQKRTKIRKKYLKAIEEENFDPIPGVVYTKAFIKGYAKEVGLDGNKLTHKYDKFIEQEQEEEEKEELEKKEAQFKFSNINDRYVKILLVVGLIILIGFLVYNFFWINNSSNSVKAPVDNSQPVQQKIANDKDEEDLDNIQNSDRTESKDEKSANEYKEVDGQNKIYNNNKNKKVVNTTNVKDKEENQINTLKTEKLDNQKQQVITVNNPDTNKIEIIANARSWLQLSIDSQNTFQGFIDKGEVQEYKLKDKLVLTIGNGVAISIKIGNKIYGPWGKTGEVLKKEILLR